MDALCGNLFCPSSPGLFRPLHDAILYGGDRYMHLADLESYIAAQDRVTADARNASLWRQMSLLNVAGSAASRPTAPSRSTRADIWHIAPVPPASVERE